MSNKSENSPLVYWIVGLMTLSVFAFIILASSWDTLFPKPVKPSRQAAFDCIQHENVALHIHPMLKITVKDESVQIPSDIGVSDVCMRAVHTHDVTGTIHIEHPQNIAFALGDFFAIWDKDIRSFGQNMKMKVNGQDSTEYENYLMKDKDQIELIYE